jgi:actin-related protein
LQDSDPRFLAWRGAALGARLTAAQESWISSSEFVMFGSKLARERSPFLW